MSKSTTRIFFREEHARIFDNGSLGKFLNCGGKFHTEAEAVAESKFDLVLDKAEHLPAKYKYRVVKVVRVETVEVVEEIN